MALARQRNVVGNWLRELADRIDGRDGNGDLQRLGSGDLQRLAFADPLTELANRTAVVQRLAAARNRFHRQEILYAVLFIDLDRFKEVNDTFGHRVGDEVLREIGQRMRDCIRESDTVGRFGGDEFIVCLEDLGDDMDAARSQVTTTVHRLAAAISTTITVDEHVIRVGASVGAVIPTDGADTDQVIDLGDKAMYAAKRSDQHFVLV